MDYFRRICSAVPSVWIGIGLLLGVMVQLCAGASPVVNGDFESPVGSAAGWSALGDGVAVEEVTGGRALSVRVQGTATTQTLTLDPTWKTLLIGAKIKAEELKLGRADWQDVRLAVTFTDANGQLVDYGDSPRLRADFDWIVVWKVSSVPAGAKHVLLAPSVLCEAKAAWFDDVVIIPNGTQEEADQLVLTPAADGARPQVGTFPAAALPLELSRTRAELLLNGLWQFVPANGHTAPELGWGYIEVPGSWMDPKHIVVQGTGPAWTNVDLKSLAGAWYRTRLTVPAQWTGREVAIEFRRLSTDAQVYVDGKKVGAVGFPEGEVVLTNAITLGKPFTLDVFVVASVSDAQTMVLMGAAPGQSYSVKSELWNAGLIGEVKLLARPEVARIINVFIQTSVRKNTLTLDIDLQGQVQSAGTDVTATITDAATGVEAKRFVKRIDARPGVNTVSFDWADAKLWDVAQPNLYKLHLSVSGAGVEDEIIQRFGFREFWIEGRKFMLNGTEFRARPDLMGGSGLPRSRAQMLEKISLGFNFGEFWPHDLAQRGTEYEGWRGYDIADELGLPVTGLTPHMGWMAGNVSSPERLSSYTEAARREMVRHRNHPSIVMWGSSGNMFGPIMDPAVIGQREASEPGRLQRSPHMIEPVKYAELGVAALRQFDSTRPIFIHHGGASGDVYTMNHYLNMIPLQEREEWLSTYMIKGDMPIMYVEFGTPVYATMMRGRNNYGNAQQTEPLMTEYVASHLGRKSYELEPADYRATIVKLFLAGQRYEGWHWDKTMKFAPNWIALQELFLQNTWRSWRTAGMTGGMIPWDDGYATLDGKRTRAGDALARNNSSTLAWICGPADAFTDKTHNFRAGQAVKKQIALLNDTRISQSYKLTTRIVLDGVELHSINRKGNIDVSNNAFIPFEFVIPQSLKAEKLEGQITLEAEIGGVKHVDTFSFRAFASQQPGQQLPVLIFDPAGKTTEMLKSIGQPTRQWDGASSPGSTLVIGREAIEIGKPLPGDLDAFARSGGRVLVMAQQANALTHGFGLRVAGVQSRRAFCVQASHPVTAGLDDNDLRDWAGTGTLQEPYPDYINDPRYNVMSPANFPMHGWRWGNRHTVASVAIEKPHRGGWTPILECEFDLAYTPLMEMTRGLGSVVWCQLDLEDQASADPAAEKLLRQLIGYVATAPKEARRPVVYIGDEAGRKMLSETGVAYKEGSIDDVQSGQLVVVHAGKNVELSSLEKYAEQGGNVLVLGGAIDGVTFHTDPAFNGSLDVPTWAQTRGISVSELRTRVPTSQNLVREAAGFEIGADGLLARRIVGKGVVVVCQLDPESLQADVATYRRLTRWRQTRAITQLLTNLGAEFDTDGRLLNMPIENVRPPVVELAGAWQAKLINKLPAAASPDVKHSDVGVSEQAKLLLRDPKAPFDGADNAEMPTEMGLINADWKDCDGEAVFRRTFDVEEGLLGRDLVVSLGALDDYDEVWINGQKIGETGSSDTQSWATKRVYAVPPKLVRANENVIVVRVWDAFGGGGFTTHDAADLQIRIPIDENAIRMLDGFYYPDYRPDFELGDDPYRYYNW